MIRKIGGSLFFTEVHDTSACKQKLAENGMKLWKDENGAVWSFENCLCPRYTTPDLRIADQVMKEAKGLDKGYSEDWDSVKKMISKNIRMNVLLYRELQVLP